MTTPLPTRDPVQETKRIAIGPRAVISARQGIGKTCQLLSCATAIVLLPAGGKHVNRRNR
ncbi:hypothetical protein [Humitalea rosea]|nr:hypothetical protein [Humitalea rosea]